MVKFNYILGIIAIIAGILCALLFNNNLYAIIGSVTGILYGTALIFQASYFERLETVTAEARANTKLIMNYLTAEMEKLETETGKIQVYTNAIYNQINQKATPTPAAPDPLKTWKPQE